MFGFKREKLKKIRQQFEDIARKFRVTNPQVLIIYNIVADLINIETSALIKEKDPKEFIPPLRSKLNRLIQENAISDELALTICYKLLNELAKIEPLNDWADKSHWICPITFKESTDFRNGYSSDNSITLSSGYLYDKEALLKWFRRSQVFKDPVTKVKLPQYDIDRLVNLEKGLEKIQEIEQTYQANRKRLLSEQALRMNRGYGNAVKKNFLAWSLTHDPYSAAPSNENNLLTKVHAHIRKADVIQFAPKSQKPEDIQYNFSNVDLSGLYFYDHKLSELDLRGANLSNCIFFQSSGTGSCMHVDLSQANLENAKFYNLPEQGLCIKTTNLSYANLKNVDFTGICNWSGANVTGANLSSAYLYKKNGDKVTGEQLKKHLNKKAIIGLDFAIFNDNAKGPITETMPTLGEEATSPSTVPIDVHATQSAPEKRNPTFTEFKQAFSHEPCNPFKKPFSKMRWGLLFNAYKSIEDVEKYARTKPESLTAKVLNSLKR